MDNKTLKGLVIASLTVCFVASLVTGINGLIRSACLRLIGMTGGISMDVGYTWVIKRMFERM